MRDRIQIPLMEHQIEALKRMAQDHVRDPKLHAQFLIVQALERAGYLPEKNRTDVNMPLEWEFIEGTDDYRPLHVAVAGPNRIAHVVEMPHKHHVLAYFTTLNADRYISKIMRFSSVEEGTRWAEQNRGMYTDTHKAMSVEEAFGDNNL